MLWLRMVGIVFRLAWPDFLTPWRSPLLRWRMETYGIRDAEGHMLHAADLTALHFWNFFIRQHREVVQFLRWSASL